jgi:hypothetical protein
MSDKEETQTIRTGAPERFSVREFLEDSVREELMELDDEIRACREEKDRPGFIRLVEAKASIKLDVAATTIRVNANIARIARPERGPGAIPEGLRSAAEAARRKLRGEDKPGGKTGAE